MARRFSSLLYYIPSLSKKGLVNGLPKMKYVRIKLCSSCEMRFKAKEVSFKDQKQFLFPKEAKFGFTWTCVSNACCKHKWEEKSIFWNGVVERQKTVLLLRLLGTLLSALRLPLSFWVEAVATACLVPQGQKASDYDNSDSEPPRQNVVPSAEKPDSSHQGHDLMGPDRDHPLEQVRGNPTMPVQTRQQLATDPKMCMFTLMVSIVEPKNIKEARADSAWIEAMQD
ncbi:hypothetical protein Tco_0595807 [Tanacetum coccineum]